MAHSYPPEPKNRRRNEQRPPTPTRRPTALSLLLFWPFHLFHLLTRTLRQPLRFFARLLGHPLVAGLYILAFLALIYGFRAQSYDL